MIRQQKLRRNEILSNRKRLSTTNFPSRRPTRATTLDLIFVSSRCRRCLRHKAVVSASKTAGNQLHRYGEQQGTRKPKCGVCHNGATNAVAVLHPLNAKLAGPRTNSRVAREQATQCPRDQLRPDRVRFTEQRRNVSCPRRSICGGVLERGRRTHCR